LKAKRSKALAILGVILVVLGIALVSGKLELAVINVYNPNVVPAITKIDPSGTEASPTVKAPGAAYKPFVEFNVSAGSFDIQTATDVSYCTVSGIGVAPIYPSYGIGESGFKAMVLIWSSGAPSSGIYKLTWHIVVKRLTDNKLFTFDVAGWVKFEQLGFTWYVNDIKVSGRGEYEAINIPGPTLTFKAVPSGDASAVSKVYVKIWKPVAGFDPVQVRSMFPADYTVTLSKQSDGSYTASWTATYGTYYVFGYYQLGGSDFLSLSLVYEWSQLPIIDGRFNWALILGGICIAIGAVLVIRYARA
jgi:hypothetical protein